MARLIKLLAITTLISINSFSLNAQIKGKTSENSGKTREQTPPSKMPQSKEPQKQMDKSHSQTTKPSDPKSGSEQKPKQNPPADNPKPVETHDTESDDVVGKGESEVIQQKSQGTINWTRQYIEAVGRCSPDSAKGKDPGTKYVNATTCAKTIAERNLAAMVYGIHVFSETDVRDAMEESDFIRTNVEAELKGYTVVPGSERMITTPNGGNLVEIRLRISINDLAATIDTNYIKRKRKEQYHDQVSDASSNLQASASDLGFDPNEPLKIKIKGHDIDPSLFPVVKSEDGRILFDFSKLSQHGQVPKYLQLAKDVINLTPWKEGSQVVELIQTGKGEFKLPDDVDKRIKAEKTFRILNTISNIGKVVLGFFMP